jgi:hypothetical protein
MESPMASCTCWGAGDGLIEGLFIEEYTELRESNKDEASRNQQQQEAFLLVA